MNIDKKQDYLIKISLKSDAQVLIHIAPTPSDTKRNKSSYQIIIAGMYVMIFLLENHSLIKIVIDAIGTRFF